MKIALLFPGQGAQYIGMCKDLIKNYPVAAEIFEEAGDVLKLDIKRLVFQGTMEELTPLNPGQPIVVTASYALYRVLVQETGIIPFCGTGHSLGEISALIAAGGISFRDGVKFASMRGSIMYRAYSEKKGRTALILDLPEDVVEEEVKKINETVGFVSICCYNSPRQFVVSGEQNALRELDKTIKKINGELVPFSMIAMKVDAPFHCSLMDFIKTDINRELSSIEFKPLQWNVISTVTALPYESHLDIENNLTIQLVSAVKWRQAISYILSQDVSAVFEIGPQSTMKNLFMENKTKIKCYSFDDKEDKEKIMQFLLSYRLL